MAHQLDATTSSSSTTLGSAKTQPPASVEKNPPQCRRFIGQLALLSDENLEKASFWYYWEWLHQVASASRSNLSPRSLQRPISPKLEPTEPASSIPDHSSSASGESATSRSTCTASSASTCEETTFETPRKASLRATSTHPLELASSTAAHWR